MDEDKYFEEEHEKDIYSSDEVDNLMEDDKITVREEAFMKGYDKDLEKKKLEEEESKSCPFCSYEIDIDDKLCPVCGATIKEASEGV